MAKMHGKKVSKTTKVEPNHKKASLKRLGWACARNKKDPHQFREYIFCFNYPSKPSDYLNKWRFPVARSLADKYDPDFIELYHQAEIRKLADEEKTESVSTMSWLRIRGVVRWWECRLCGKQAQDSDREMDTRIRNNLYDAQG